MKKLTTEEFIRRSKEKHGDRYGYEWTVVDGSASRVKLTCREHGVFTVIARLHIGRRNQGCPYCSGSAIHPDGFKKKARLVHGDRYDYSGITKVESSLKLPIICREHGVFRQMTHSHLAGSGCPNCVTKGRRNLDTEWFKSKALEVHGDTYDYSKAKYTGKYGKITIICEEHGEFEQESYVHLRGCGCFNCGEQQRNAALTKTTEEFIAESKEIHGDKFDYSLTDYVNNKTQLKIICNKHREFITYPSNHLNGDGGCPKCAREIIDVAQVKTTEQFIGESKEIHGDKFDYSLTNYVNNRKKIKVICNKHGEFITYPKNHQNGRGGCPKCTHQQSRLEMEILDFIKYNYKGTIIERERGLEGVSEVDIYLPDRKVAVEVNSYYTHAFQVPASHPWAKPETIDIRGKKPYEGTLWFRPADHMQKKHATCKELGIRLITIWDFYWNNGYEHHYKDMVLNAIGCFSEVIYARKCEKREISKEDAREFFDRRSFHASKRLPNKDALYLALYYKGEPVMVMAAANGRTVERMVTETGVRVVGGLSRLLKEVKPGTTYFTTNDAGSITKELPGWESVPYGKRRGFLVKGSEIYRDIWLNHAKVEKLIGVTRRDESNGYWNAMVAAGYYYVADSGLSKFVKK